MARIRTIKPEFWTSEQVVNCSIPARLLFIGMWNFADDSGVLPASVQRLKMQVLPGDDVSLESVREMMKELVNNGLVREYDVNGKVYWQITGFVYHQRIDQPTHRHPLPDGSIPENFTRRRQQKGDVR